MYPKSIRSSVFRVLPVAVVLWQLAWVECMEALEASIILNASAMSNISVTATIPGNIVFGGLFSIRQRDHGEECARLTSAVNIQRVEAMLYAIDEVGSSAYSSQWNRFYSLLQCQVWYMYGVVKKYLMVYRVWKMLGCCERRRDIGRVFLAIQKSSNVPSVWITAFIDTKTIRCCFYRGSRPNVQHKLQWTLGGKLSVLRYSCANGRGYMLFYNDCFRLVKPTDIDGYYIII